MDIQHIKYFLAVAGHQSFSRAAESLYVTQPILTRCIKNLEKELDVQLIVRSSKSFALTDAGRALFEDGTRLVEAHQDIFRHIHDIKSTKVGEVHIASPGVLLDMYFPRLVTEYHRENPGIRISISENGSRHTVQAVRNGTADLGLVMLPVEDPYDLNFVPIVRDEVRVLVRQDHPYASEAAIPVSRLREEDIITYNDSTTLHNLFLMMCREEGFVPRIVCQSSMPNFILETISYGSCIGILPGPMLHQFRTAGLTSVPLAPHFPWEIAMITRKDRYLSCAAKSFLQYAQAFLARGT